jgi:hypothetical protein
MPLSVLHDDPAEIISSELPGISVPAAASRVSLVFDGRTKTPGLLRLWLPFAVIELQEPAPIPLPSHAVLQYISSEGVLHHRGGLTVGAPELPRFITFRPAGSPQLLLARQRLRAELCVPVAVRRADGTVIEAETSNLRTTDLDFAHRTNVTVGELVDLRISLDVFSPAIAARAQIVAISDAGLATAQYVQITPAARERLEWRIFQHFLSGLKGLRG